MPKEDCKYWDKCYQKNEYHLQKYNHPEPGKKEAKETAEGEKAADNTEHKQARKRKLTENNVEKDGNDAEEQNDGVEGDEAGTSKSDSGETDTEPKRKEYDVDDLRKEVMGNIAGKNYMLMLDKRIKLSEQKEYDTLVSSDEFIRHKFLVEMPKDFYEFWKFAKESAGDTEVLEYFEKQFQLKLVGPFEFLAGRFHEAKIYEPGEYLRHWRFFYDPPEFQTVFVRKGTGIHYGYWRDEPKEKERLLLARNDSTKSCEFEFVAGNMFDVFTYYLENDFPSTPFNSGSVANMKKQVQKYVEANELQLDKLEPLRKIRSSKIVAKTFHRAGIVVPVDADSNVGYRPLNATDAELKKILKLFETAGEDESVKAAVMGKLQPIATAASIALDECDFGTSLELGIDLFCSGRLELHALIQSVLIPAYTLLSRPQFIAISKAHLEKRSKSLELSVFGGDKK